MELWVTVMVVAAAMVYAVNRIRQAFQNPCRGCALAKNCEKKRKNRKNIWQCRK
jgi:hypothetical protein